MTNKITLSREVGEMILRNRDRLGSGIIDPIRAALSDPVLPAVDQLHPPERLVEDDLIGPGVLYRDAPVPPAGEAQQVHTDCRSEEGITVGLVDTVINCARLLKSRPTTAAVEYALQDLRADKDVAALVADPVPPADYWEGYTAHVCYKDINDLKEMVHHLEGVLDDVPDGQLVDRAHAARLQAEVEHWRNRSAQWKERVAELTNERNDLQSELTEARELLNVSYQLLGLNSSLISYRLHMEEIGKFTSNQSAPADKAPPLIQALHANGDRIAMEAGKGHGEPMAWLVESPSDLEPINGVAYTKEQADMYRAGRWNVQPVYAEQPAPVAMPERMEIPSEHQPAYVYRKGWNACLDEVARLNGLTK